MLAVTVVIEVADLADADVVRARLLEFLRSDPAVLAASAPFPVLSR